MTEIQEKAIVDALSMDRGSVHFAAEDFDVAYIYHKEKKRVLVQFCNQSGGRNVEKKMRGTLRSWIKADQVVAEVDALAKEVHCRFAVCWHRSWGDGRCNRIV